MLDVKRAGAATYAEAESTCVVFGMPREAIAPGGVGQVLPLQDIAGKVPLRFGKERAVRA
jgi:two-component system chemotaxis response regulator CheB